MHYLLRTQNDIKNYFYATMNKGIRRLNKLIGFKKDPSSIRRIKPTIISKVFEQQQKTKLHSTQTLQTQGIFNLILNLSRNQTAEEDFIEYLENQELIKKAESFLGKLLQENRLYQQSKETKKLSKRSRRVSIVDVKSQQMEYGLDISEYLCLDLKFNDCDQLRPKSQGTPVRQSSNQSEYDNDSLFSSEKNKKKRSQTQ